MATENKDYKYHYEFARPAVTVDIVIFGYDDTDELKVLLIQRGIEPFEGQWALPGGFVHENEELEAAALRKLKDETGLEDAFLEQLFTFGGKGRDPRGHTVSVAYYALVNLPEKAPEFNQDTRDARWVSMGDLPKLAFDHQEILETAASRLRGKIRYYPIGFHMLPDKFKLSQLQKLYEVILGHPLDKRNFRKKITRMDLLIDLNELEQNVAHRAARLYRFNKEKYEQLEKEGFNFKL